MEGVSNRLRTSTSLKASDPKLTTSFLPSASAIILLALSSPSPSPEPPLAANTPVANLVQASKKSFLTYSFTSTKSGAYGDRPANPNLALTIALAAASTSAVRSTTATTLALAADTNSLLARPRPPSPPPWSTTTAPRSPSSLTTSPSLTKNVFPSIPAPPNTSRSAPLHSGSPFQTGNFPF